MSAINKRNGRMEITPKPERLGGVIKAENDDEVVTLSQMNDAIGSISDSQWTTSGSDIYYTTGKVGIGINAPTAELHIKGAGNTSATYSVKVNSSTVSNMFTVRDDGIVNMNSTTTVGISDNTADFNINHNVNGIDYISLWNNNLATGMLFIEEGAIGMQMTTKNGASILANIHMFANGPYGAECLRMDANDAAINFAGTSGTVKVTGTGGWLKINGANGIFDISGTDGNDIRIGTDGNGTAAKGIYLKAYSGAAWRTGIKYLNAAGEPTVSINPDATAQKLSFWGAVGVVQPTTAGAAATFAANTSGIVNDTATFDGYTIGQVVKALRNLGLLA